MIRFLSLVRMVLAVAAVFSISQAAVIAQTVPFVIAGSGDIPAGLPLVPEVGEGPHTSAGIGSSVGVYRGDGTFRVVENLSPDTALFESGQPFHFTSVRDGSTLACHYGRTDVEIPAAEPGFVQLYPVDAANGVFFAVFLAEFTPALDECTGRFARLEDGSFLMLAISDPFRVDPATGFGYHPDDPARPIRYRWFGSGSLTFGRRGKS